MHALQYFVLEIWYLTMPHVREVHKGRGARPAANSAEFLALSCAASTQKDHTAGWAPYLPSALSGLWARPSPILQIAVDPHRNILYTRAQNSSIQVLLSPLVCSVSTV